MGLTKQIAQIMEATGEKVVTELKSSFKKQGHKNTGKGLDSIEQVTYESQGAINTDINMADYLEIVNRGVKKSKIPFGGRKTGQVESKYIQGLVQYFFEKGYSYKKALSFAFATAKVHKKEGMSTIKSSRFSETGKRQKFIEETDIKKDIEQTEINVLNEVEREANLILDILITN